MICNNCGEMIPDGAAVCPKCGAPVAGVPNGVQPNAGVNYGGQPNMGAQPNMGSPYAAQAQAKKPVSGLAIGSLITSILGLLTSCLGVGGFLGIIALILAIVAGKKGDKSAAKVASIVLSIIAIVIGAIVCIVYGATFAATGMQYSAYANKSKLATDAQMMDAMHTSMLAALMDPEVVNSADYDDAISALEEGVYLSDMSPDDNALYEAFFDMLQVDDGKALLKKTLTSQVEDWYFEYDDDGNKVKVKIKAVGDKLSDDAEEKLSTD